MKKRIAILGSTGSIGKSTLDVVKKDKKNFEIVLLTANNNYKKLIQQAKQFNAKNVLIKNHKYYLKVKKSLKKTKVYYGNISLKKIVKKKIDYTMSAIVGIAGLQPTVDAIKFSKTIAIANKETIICGWEILSKHLKKHKTKMLPIDSEHFSILELTKNVNNEAIDEIIITYTKLGVKYRSIKKPPNVKIIEINGSIIRKSFSRPLIIELFINMSPIERKIKLKIIICWCT